MAFVDGLGVPVLFGMSQMWVLPTPSAHQPRLPQSYDQVEKVKNLLYIHYIFLFYYLSFRIVNSLTWVDTYRRENYRQLVAVEATQ